VILDSLTIFKSVEICRARFELLKVFKSVEICRYLCIWVDLFRVGIGYFILGGVLFL
jgi:hypothetical protein